MTSGHVSCDPVTRHPSVMWSCNSTSQCHVASMKLDTSVSPVMSFCVMQWVPRGTASRYIKYTKFQISALSLVGEILAPNLAIEVIVDTISLLHDPRKAIAFKIKATSLANSLQPANWHCQAGWQPTDCKRVQVGTWVSHPLHRISLTVVVTLTIYSHADYKKKKKNIREYAQLEDFSITEKHQWIVR